MQIAPKTNAAVSTDVVIFTIRAGRLSVLLVRRQNAPYAGLWSLPGGLVGEGEALEDSALRILLEKTGVQGCIWSSSTRLASRGATRGGGS